LPPRHRKPTKSARKEIAAGTALIPKEVVDRITGGENALRVLREWRGKTQLYISHKTNIGQGYISDPRKRTEEGDNCSFEKNRGCAQGSA
jgi:hypothetical protein